MRSAFVRIASLALISIVVAVFVGALTVRQVGSAVVPAPPTALVHGSAGHASSATNSEGTESNRTAWSRLEPSVASRIARKAKKLALRGPKRYDEPQEAMDFFLAQRLNPWMDALPLEHLRAVRAEIELREALDAAKRGRDKGVPVSWAEIGPGNIGGRTRAIVINPVDPNIMYAAGVAGGVWKSIDAGASWTATDDFMLNIAVASLAMDPGDPDILYAGTGEGFFNSDGVRGLGIFKTVDAGATWTQLAGTVDGTVSFGAFFRVNDVLVSSANNTSGPDGAVYACTRYGVWRSLDGGASWFVILQNPNFINDPLIPVSNGSAAGCMDLVLAPRTAKVCVGGTNPGSVCEVDSQCVGAGGACLVVSQKLCFGGSNDDSPCTVNANCPGGVCADQERDRLVASFGSFDADGMFRSFDGGDTWAEVGTPSDLQVFNQGRVALGQGVSDSSVIYASMVDNGSGNPSGVMVNVFRSTDDGLTWSPRLDFGNPFSSFLMSNLSFTLGCFGSGFSGQGWYDNVMAVDPVDTNIVWLGGIDLFRSDDGGQNFNIASYWFLSPSDPNYVHADHHALVFHPQYDGAANQTLYSGSDGGLARTDNARAATSIEDCPNIGPDPLPSVTWTGLNNGYAVTQFYHGDSARDEDTFAGGTQDNGTLRVNSAATPLAWEEIIGGDGGYFQIDPTNSQIMYGETQRFPRIQKSTDGGNTFVSATNGITDSDGLFITPFAMDQTSPVVLWTGGSRPWRTMDGAGLWEVVGPNFSGPGTLSAIAIAPSDSDTVYLGYNNGYVVRANDALSAAPTWTILDGVNGLNIGAHVSSLAVDPDNPALVYATYSTFGVSHVLKSTDSGSSWVAIDGAIAAAGIPEIPVHWLAIRPCNTDVLYVGTELGVFRSDDAGSTWVTDNDGLANTVVETLDFQSDYRLVAFTHGRGAFRLALSCPCDPGSPVVDCNSNSNPDECDLASGSSPDCNSNGVPDECDIAPGGDSDDCDQNTVPDECEPDCNNNGVVDACDVNPADPDGNTLVSEDCNANVVPDECEQDCNANSVPDDCDIDPTDPDGNSQVSPDCNGNTYPDECDTTGNGVLVSESFESGGVPVGWSASGIFQVSDVCGTPTGCDGVFSAYAGDPFVCAYGDNQLGELALPPVQLGPAQSELRFCHNLDSEFDFDFAEVYVNGTRVFRESGFTGGFVNVQIDLTPFRGQIVNIIFRFFSDAGVSGTLGWQVDSVEIESGSADCNSDSVPDECAPDDNLNQIPDVCEGACCEAAGPNTCADFALIDQAACVLTGGTFLPNRICTGDCNGNLLVDACEVATGGTPDCNTDLVPDACQLAGNDCDSNAVPDECDPDVNGNSIPDACEAITPLPATSYPVGARKNRYVSFVAAPLMTGRPHGYLVTHIGPGSSWYVSTPRSTPAAIAGLGLTFLVSDGSPPLFDFAALPVVHVGGCMIAPGESYEIRSTLDGVTTSAPLMVFTAAIPTNGRFWADVVGTFSALGDGTTLPPTPPGAWTPPNGSVSGFDISAVLQGAASLVTAPHLTWADVDGEVANRATNGSDVLRVVNAFSVGTTREFYPYRHPDASGCTICPPAPPAAACPAPPLEAALLP